MSRENTPVESTTHGLEQYSTAALLALRSRLTYGNDSAYDHFLCDYVGDPVLPDFRPIECRAPSGAVYAYNSQAPGQVRRSFTREGSMVNIRHVQGRLLPGDEHAEFFVASADLWTGQITEWRVANIIRRGNYGRESILIDLFERPDIAAVDGRPESDDTLEGLLARRRQIGSIGARVLLDAERGNNSFTLAGSFEAPLLDVRQLVIEVNQLTALSDIDLDTRREQVARQLATVTQISQIA